MPWLVLLSFPSDRRLLLGFIAFSDCYEQLIGLVLQDTTGHGQPAGAADDKQWNQPKEVWFFADFVAKNNNPSDRTKRRKQ